MCIIAVRAGLPRVRRVVAKFILALAGALLLAAPGLAADAIRIGFSLSLTGVAAEDGKTALVAYDIWRERINAAGGLLGRKIEFVRYDDRSNFALVPGLYVRLVDVDKVDLVVAPVGAKLVSPALQVMIPRKKALISLFAVGANTTFGYDRYFQILSEGRRMRIAPSLGFMDIAMTMNPKPTTIAIVRAATEYGRMVAAGLRETAHSLGVTVVYDRPYPSLTTDFAPIVQAVRAKSPDLVFVVSFQRDTEGLIRAADAAGLKPKMFGGIMAGLQSVAVKQRLGPLLNGLVVHDWFAAEPTMIFPGTAEFLKAYAARAAETGADPLGLSIAPYVYAQMEVLAEAVTAVGSIDHERIADRLHRATFKTIVGDVKFSGAGEMESSRNLFIQFRNIVAGDRAQFATAGRQVILHPPDLKSGEFIYPFEKARGR